MSFGMGECSRCGAKNVALVGLNDTGKASDWWARRPVCSWCFHTDHGVVLPIAIEFEDEEPTTTYTPETRARVLAQVKKP